jgi:hypothetical protein
MDMRTLTKLWATACLAVALICLSSFLPAFAARESMQVTRLSISVTIDGKWTSSDEWSDTNRVSMYLTQGAQSTAYVRTKHDADSVYMLVDFISDTSKATTQTGGGSSHYDGLNIEIDKDVNDNSTDSDMTVQLRWNNGKSAPEAVVPSWIQGTISYDATNDPDSKTPHAIYELAIPMGTFELDSAVRISVWDPSRGVNMHWPQYKGSWSTTYFGDLIFSEVVVPEFPFVTGAVLAVLVLATFVLTKRVPQRSQH